MLMAILVNGEGGGQGGGQCGVRKPRLVLGDTGPVPQRYAIIEIL